MKDQEEAYRAVLKGALKAASQVAGEILPPEVVSRISEEHLCRPPRQRYLFARNSPRLARPEVVRHLTAESFGLRHTAPQRMLAIGEAAVEVADAMSRLDKGAPMPTQVRAEAWGNLANARRVVGDLVGAERAWELVERELAPAIDDPLLEARLIDLRANLRFDQGRVDEAVASFKRAAAAYAELGEEPLAARAFIKLAIASKAVGNNDRAIWYSVRAGQLLSAVEEGDVFVGLIKDLGFFLEALGYDHEALFVLHTASKAFSRQHHSLIAVRVHWLEARILARLGYCHGAAALLDVVRKRFVKERLAFRASQVSMELAEAYARLERFDLVENLAEEMYPVFLSQDLPVEATAALTLFVKAAKRHRVTVGRIAAVVRALSDLEKRGSIQTQKTTSA